MTPDPRRETPVVVTAAADGSQKAPIAVLPLSRLWLVSHSVAAYSTAGSAPFALRNFPTRRSSAIFRIEFHVTAAFGRLGRAGQARHAVRPAPGRAGRDRLALVVSGCHELDSDTQGLQRVIRSSSK